MLSASPVKQTRTRIQTHRVQPADRASILMLPEPRLALRVTLARLQMGLQHVWHASLVSMWTSMRGQSALTASRGVLIWTSRLQHHVHHAKLASTQETRRYVKHVLLASVATMTVQAATTALPVRCLRPLALTHAPTASLAELQTQLAALSVLSVRLERSPRRVLRHAMYVRMGTRMLTQTRLQRVQYSTQH